MANANTRFKIKNPQAALLSNHEVLLHLRAQEAEYSGTDGTGRKRTKPAGLQSALKDVSFAHTPLPVLIICSKPPILHSIKPRWKHDRV